MKIANTKILLAGLTLLTANLHAQNVVTQSGTILNGPDPAASFPKTTPFTYNQFDSSLGTLTRVILTISASSSADITITNNTTEARDYATTLIATITGTLNAVSPLQAIVAISETTESVLINPSENAAFDDLTGSGANSASTTSAADLLTFIGTGTLAGSVHDTQGWSNSGGGDGTTAVTNSQSTVEWTVEYEYTATVVPEPSVVLLGGIALLGLLRRRRA